jgi:hypothetical protein
MPNEKTTHEAFNHSKEIVAANMHGVLFRQDDGFG